MKHIFLGSIGIWALFIIGCSQNTQTSDVDVTEMLESVDATEIENTIKSFSEFKTRYHNDPEAIEAQEWLKSKWEEIAQDRDDVHVELFDHPGISPMPSVILTIKGSTIPEEKIVLGAHADSAVKETTGVPASDEESLGRRSPGADDNASGIATITEVLRVLMHYNYRPTRTIMFMAYAAEEIGLKGSEHIANSFKEDGQEVIGVLNFDMTNYRGSEDLDMVMIDDADYTSQKQNAFLEELIQTYLPEVKWEYDKCGYGCSDHASWHNAGFPASMLIEARLREITPHIHKVTDTFENSGGNAEHSVDFAKVSLVFVTELDRSGICRYDQEQCN